MLNEALGAAVAGALETYSQRQRAATSLLSALKGVTGALGKAGRSLNEYAGQSEAAEGTRLAHAQESFGALRLKDEAVDPLLPELRRDVKALSTVVTALRDAQTALRAETVDAVRLGRALKALQESRSRDAAVDALLPELDRALQEALSTLGSTFGEALRDALAEQGVEVRGRPPHIEIGRFELTTDFSTRAGTLSYGKNLVLKRVPLSVDAVVSAYQREARSIEGRNEDGERWIGQLYSAWETARQRRANADQRANIVDCYYEMVLLRQPRTFHSEPLKSGFVDYRRAQFAYDFFQFTQQQRRAYKGLHVFAHAATKSQADSTDKSMWIVEGASPHNGRYIADVVFSQDG